MRHTRLIPLSMFTLLILVAPVAVWGQGSFTPIDYPGANLTVAMGINWVPVPPWQPSRRRRSDVRGISPGTSARRATLELPRRHRR